MNKNETNVSWRYVDRDGNPTEAGEYLTVLIYPGYHNGDETGITWATLGIRYFGNVDNMSAWAMYDQPKEGLAWTEGIGSDYHERVHAWLPINSIKDIQLPEGVEWEG